MLTAQEIRQRYLDFFARHNHRIVKSGALIPPEDPSLLFTNAGMVQFKKLFLGEEKRDYNTATTCQKCLRVSGKHNDLENVGRTARHHTFFEMLGNFSFGAYFKEEAIPLAWEFVTKELGLPPEKLWVTVYKDDEEAIAIWKKVANLPDERIVRMGEKDNFWTMGDTGPCGPCSEIYFDQGEDMGCGPDCGIGKCDCDRFLEIWNLVFTQFDQAKDGSRQPLAAPNIDTGMGLERIAAVCQGKKSNFDCDLFRQIIDYASDLAHVKYSESAPDTNDIDTALRVISDHSRAAAFLIAEGVLPSNASRGYVLRRLIRRALRFATLMGVHEPFMHKVAGKVTEVMGDAYPELRTQAGFIEKALLEEEKRFALTLDKGLALLEEELTRLSAHGEKEISGDFCFKLYDTYGFPLDIVWDVAQKKGFTVDNAGFEAKMCEQRERARAHQKKSGLLGQAMAEDLANACKDILASGKRSLFVGYDTLDSDSQIIALLNASGEEVAQLEEGDSGYVLASKTPFYGESGGQMGDCGQIDTVSGKARVTGAIKPDPQLILHEVEMEAGELFTGQNANLHVEPDTRLATARNHTCTHLLHASLRRILGKHVKQAGSLVDSKRLRFDFSHFSALGKEELAAVERDVNRAIMANFPVNACEMDQEEALAKGAMALFSEKYGDRVRVLTVGNEEDEPESMELCGGTHLTQTGQAGAFLIVSESAVAAGIRRIEAVTGWNAYDVVLRQRAETSEAAAILKITPAKLVEKVKGVQEELKKLRKVAEKSSVSIVDDWDKYLIKVNGVNLLEHAQEDVSMKTLRETMDKLRGRYSSDAIICLAGIEEGKVNLLLHVSRDLQQKYTAPDLIRLIAPLVGGSGGGRPDLAQAGGTKPGGINEAFELLKKQIGA